MNRSDYVIELQESMRTNREHIMDSTQMLIFTCLLILVILTIWLLKQKNITYVHETGLALVYGYNLKLFTWSIIEINKIDFDVKELCLVYQFVILSRINLIRKPGRFRLST